MDTPAISLAERRVLLLPPTRRDGELTRAMLSKAGLECLVCQTYSQLVEEMAAGAAVVVLTDDAIKAGNLQTLDRALAQQPPWSDLPLVLLLRSGASPSLSAALHDLPNVTLLERPTLARSVISAVRAAARSRERQYQIRDQLESIARAEAHTRDLQRQLELAIEASELGIFHCEMPPRRIVWNDRCKSHFWLSPDAEVDFDLFYSLLHPGDRESVRQAVEACIYGGQRYDVEYRVVSPAGQIRWIRATGQTYYDTNGMPTRFDGTTQDITPRKDADAVLLASQQQLLTTERAVRQQAEHLNRMKDEFLATLSHELRTPLNAIFGWTQILKSPDRSEQLVTEGVSVIDRNVRAQTQLIEDLLDMSRIISGKARLDLQQVELSDVVRTAIETVITSANAKGVRLETAIDPSAGWIAGDPTRLRQILWNLLSNAIKFTPQGGLVRVHVDRLDSTVEIRVSDSGEGISPDFLPHLFERFSQADGSITRKQRGLGLGLSIVKHLVELHGGAVSAESAGIGRGATFRIVLPLHADEQAAVRQPTRHSLCDSSSAVDAPRLDGLKVLVIDDDTDAREMVKRVLLQHDAVLASASSASEARSLLDSFRPDIILSDIGMPDEDGYSFMAKLRSEGVKTPAVALTAFARAEDRIHCLQAGYQMHLPKPVEPAELVTVIAGLSGRDCQPPVDSPI